MEEVTTPFKVVSPYSPAGDQPNAIAELTERINAGERDVVLLGATGTGKSATTAWLVEKLQRPTLVIAHNKTLAAQLASELREMFPENAVEYFVSYYDYYQPEAYVPQTDTFIEKDSSINEEVERLRYSATMSLLSRRDVIVVATVSCIYGLGAPKEYLAQSLPLKVGQEIDRDDLIRALVAIQYQRNDIEFTRGNFRVKGDTVEIIAVYDEEATRIEFFGDEIEKIYRIHPLTGEILMERDSVAIYPASYYVAPVERMGKAIEDIENELEQRYRELEGQGKLLEAQRIKMRTTFDLEMIRELGFCSGIENYSKHIDQREAGEPPACLLDYFPEDFLTVIDESHVTPWLSTGSVCPQPLITDRYALKNSWSAPDKPFTCRQHQPNTNLRSQTEWSSKSFAPPDWLILKLSSNPPRDKSTTCWMKSGPEPKRTSGCW